jgi:hypothetical protein
VGARLDAKYLDKELAGRQVCGLLDAAIYRGRSRSKSEAVLKNYVFIYVNKLKNTF